MLLHAAYRALVLRQWVWAPAISVPIAVSGVWYGLGAFALGRHAKRRGLGNWQVVAFYFGWATLVLALMSPLHPLGEQLFSAHMIQHTLLMTVAAPLLVLGRPLNVGVWALPLAWRRPMARVVAPQWIRRCWSVITRPAVAWVVQGVVLWLWHAPKLYSLVLRSESIHAIQHLSFLAAALIFWWSVLPMHATRTRIGVSVMSLFTTAMHSTVLGALIAVAPVPWYPTYVRTAPEWGLSGLEDQQLAGLIMWIPAGVTYLIATLVLVARVLREPHWPAHPPASSTLRVISP